MKAVRALVTFVVLLLVWQAVVVATGVPRFILPSPLAVGTTLVAQHAVLAKHSAVTMAEILLGLFLGTASGVGAALLLAHMRMMRRWLLPLLIVSQAIPVFALAPILVLWLGYGMVSKVAMATLIIFFPVLSAFWDGLRRTEPGWLDLARTMGATPIRVLWHIRIPAALPALASGLRMAAAIAPIGAVVGEWVGASSGLGMLMLQANARMQTDMMFAALAVLACLAVTLYAGTDALLRRALPWQPETINDTEKTP